MLKAHVGIAAEASLLPASQISASTSLDGRKGHPFRRDLPFGRGQSAPTVGHPLDGTVGSSHWFPGWPSTARVPSNTAGPVMTLVTCSPFCMAHEPHGPFRMVNHQIGLVPSDPSPWPAP